MSISMLMVVALLVLMVVVPIAAVLMTKSRQE